MPHRLGLFLLTGFANSAAGWAIIIGCLAVGMSGLTANLAGYGVGLVLSFTLNRRWVFGVRGVISGHELIRFLSAFLVAYGANVAVLLYAQSILGASSILAQLPAIATYVLIFFLLSKRFVFKPAVEQ